MMTARTLVMVLFVFSANASSDTSKGVSISEASIEDMKQLAYRSDEVHAMSMAAMMKSMSSEDALHVLEKANLTTPALVEVAKDLIGNKGRLRKQPKGYAGPKLIQGKK
jgi:hypothetical protein